MDIVLNKCGCMIAVANSLAIAWASWELGRQILLFPVDTAFGTSKIFM